MYFITTKRMLEVCFSAHPNIQYRTYYNNSKTLIGIGGSQPCYFKADKEVRE